MGTEDGAILLELLEKATLNSLVPIFADPRALDARNAQAFIALDLRRIVSDEFDRPTDPDTGNYRPGRPRRR
jgi:hypothetical protein